MKNTRWTIVRDAIDADIAEGRLKPGNRLPTEPELCRIHSAGRHSVRRAMAALAMEGKVRIQQGSGSYVETPELLKYTISRRTRLTETLREQGLMPGRIRLGWEKLEADATVARALGIAVGETVTRSTYLTTADSVSIAFGSSYHPARLFPDYAARRAQFGSVTETYRSYGIKEYVRAETTVHTRRARAEEARMLAQHPDVPVLIVRAVDALTDGTPISFARVAWAGVRVRFSFESEAADISAAPTWERQDA